ncbi:hypothetical protein SARC_07641 [Sphaeroforma arctica JP610]|uniref:Uncharacterized protein n=1 Tax=Sphaeroforma arctica JP610 TaxID=667725 RepID=A0A0L0FTS9_9EUKA|nr:hypothetical protein SARC_07641 [Sphaeroforma arctica JP610]KNC79986.1 hypothetical protein SARC_07641 [Sphaeroforma arctica JP610]|eukprot:XP_014153888.1 hypothetical protein SARC_07641 [Sphaeroforma arctica JP610]
MVPIGDEEVTCTGHNCGYPMGDEALIDCAKLPLSSNDWEVGTVTLCESCLRELCGEQCLSGSDGSLNTYYCRFSGYHGNIARIPDNPVLLEHNLPETSDAHG